MRPLAWLTCAACVVLFSFGCGGGGNAPTPGPQPPSSDQPLQVGPQVIRTAAGPTLNTSIIPSTGNASFVALWGATINYAGVQELLDRIVLSSFRSSNWDIWVCDLFGENLHRVTGTGHPDRLPAWSPDGTRIAFAQERDGQGQADIFVVDENGANLTNLTSSTDYDTHPTWSPTGDRIAFHSNRAGGWDIYTMYADGSNPTALTGSAGANKAPDWSGGQAHGGIAFMSNRDGNFEIYRMDHRGLNPTRLTNTTVDEVYPSWSADGLFIAFRTAVGTCDIFEMYSDGQLVRPLADSQYYEDYPSYSTDGRFVAYESARGGGFNIWVRQTGPPGRRYRVTDGAASDGYPDLGSPTVQTARVLIGPSGSDHGYDPLWNSAYAGIVSFNADGYLGFVRVGIRTGDAAGLQVAPLHDVGASLCAVRLRAGEIVNLREDTGIGMRPIKWDFDAENPTSALLYFNANTGKLVSVLLNRSSTYPSSAAEPPGEIDVSHSVTAARTQIRGDFTAVYDGDGVLVAQDVLTVELERGSLIRAY